MTHARHKAVARRPPLYPWIAQRSVVLTGVAAIGIACFGAVSSPSAAPATDESRLAAAGSASTIVQADELDDLRGLRGQALLQAARGADRSSLDVAPPRTALVRVTTTAYTTRVANVRAAASKDAPVVVVLGPGTEIAVTGSTVSDYAGLVLDGRVVWIYAEYVAATPPAKAAEQPASGGGSASGAACSTGSGVESGLSANAVAVHRALCALFPGVTGYGGLRPGDSGEHGSGHALDVMVPTDVGNAIVAYLQPLAGVLGIRELIWRQRIWSTERAAEGWRWMEDRGSATANHYDHVHVTVS